MAFTPNLLLLRTLFLVYKPTDRGPILTKSMLAYTVPQNKNKSKTIRWLNSRNWAIIGDW